MQMSLQMCFTIRSARQLMEQLDCNLLFRWFVGLGIDDPVWHHTTYSNNRDRLRQGDIARKFFKSGLKHDKVKPLLSAKHFSVDGTLIDAGASIKSFVAKDEAAANACVCRRCIAESRPKKPSRSPSMLHTSARESDENITLDLFHQSVSSPR